MTQYLSWLALVFGMLAVFLLAVLGIWALCWHLRALWRRIRRG